MQSKNFRNSLQELVEKANPRRELSSEKAKRLAKLEAIADRLKRGANVQNRQLKRVEVRMSTHGLCLIGKNSSNVENIKINQSTNYTRSYSDNGCKVCIHLLRFYCK